MVEQAVQVAQQYDAKQLEIMRRTVAAGTSPDDFLVFLEVCKHRNLNPFAREIYAIVRSGKMTIQVSIDGFRKLAERSGKYRGQVGPQFCAADGAWKDEWLKDEPPVAARVGVKRADFDTPVWAVARYRAYVQEASPIWRKMPDLMLAKCAEALALRKAFPDEMSGLYTHEEMAQAGRPDNDAVFKRPVEQPASAIIETTAVAGETVESDGVSIDEMSRELLEQRKQQEAATPASEQQVASIRKLCQHLDKPAPEEALSYLQAKDMILSLSKDYREMREKQRAGR